MKKYYLSKFENLCEEILEEVETWNDKPNPPGGNNCKHTDAGSVEGNSCKEHSTDPGNITGNECPETSTDPGNVGGKTDSITAAESVKINNKKEIDECEGAACAAGMTTGSVMGPTPGMPSIADTATQPGDYNQKHDGTAGIDTKDIKKLYSPALEGFPFSKGKRPKKVKYPLFSRFKK